MPEQPWFRFYEEGVPRSLVYPQTTLPEILDRTAERFPQKVALRFFPDRRLPAPQTTYAQLAEQSRRFATALFRLGVRKGDRVALVLPNCPQYVIALYGALRLGAIVVNTNPTYVARELREQLDDAGCETVVILAELLPRLREIHAATRVLRVIVVDWTEALPLPVRLLVRLAQRWRGERVRVPVASDVHRFPALLARHDPEPPGADLRPDDIALLQYTGGTTGTPKAAMLSHRNLVANSLQAAAWFPRAREGREVFLAALPLFHVYGFTSVLLFGVAAAAEIVLLLRPTPVEIVLAAMQRFRVTLFPGVPTLFAALNAHPRVAQYDLRTGALCLSGAAPLSREVSETFERHTAGRLVEGYGLTEASPFTHCTPLFGERRPGSIGLPLPDTDSRIVDLETGEPLPPGHDGELALRGPQVMLGYWQRPDETAEVLREGWLLTGDIGHVDADGFFYVVDRRKDMIDASGFKVLPREVEEVLFMHPGIAEACVAGVPDPYRGETVKAFVVLRPGEALSAEEIIDFCRLHLAPFKVPRQVEIRDTLPKSMVGKYLRRVLIAEERQAKTAPQA